MPAYQVKKLSFEFAVLNLKIQYAVGKVAVENLKQSYYSPTGGRV